MILIEPRSASLLVRSLGHSLWEGLLIAGAVLALSPLIGTWRSSRRYALLMAALIAVAACPAITMLILYSPDDEPLTQNDLLSVATATPTLRVDQNPALRPVGTNSVPRTHEKVVEQNDDTFALLANGYAISVALMLLRLMLAVAGGQRLIRCAEPVEDPVLLAAIARQVRRVGLTFTPAVTCCSRVVVPCVIGAVRPMLVLPIAMGSGLSVQEIDAILAHELVHIRRYDHALNLLQRLIEAFLFFHPAVWILGRRIRLARELCCDDAVVPLIGATEYAGALIAAGHAALRRSIRGDVGLMTLGATGRMDELQQRVRRLIHVDETPRLNLKASSVLAVLIFSILILPLIAPRLAMRVVSANATHVPSMAAIPLAQDGMLPIHVAAIKGEASAMLACLARGDSPNSLSASHWSPLHYAAALGRADLVSLLIDRGADVNLVAAHSRTPLHAAAGAGGDGLTVRVSPDVIEVLLSHGAQPDIADDAGMTPLHHAASRGNVDAIRAFIVGHASIEARNSFGMTPIAFACDSGRCPAIQELVRAGADINARDNGRLTPLDHLGLTGVRITPDMKTTAQLMVDQGGQLGACAAAGLGLNEVAVKLFETYSNPTADRTTKFGRTPLHWATTRRNTALAIALLERGADPNALDHLHMTPLHCALDTASIDVQIIQSLLQYHADPNIADEFGRTSLSCAAHSKSSVVIDMLLKHGADVNHHAKKGDTPLHFAADSFGPNNAPLATVESCKQLLDHGAEPNAINAAGQTPLHVAVATSPLNVALVEELLSRGADVTVQDAMGRTPVQIAGSMWPVHPTSSTSKEK